MFLDWLTIYQDHAFDLPVIGDESCHVISHSKNRVTRSSQPVFTHKGSYCTAIQIKISGNRVTMSGNPSRVGRQDNLFGYSSLDDCVTVFNDILALYGLPPFTKGTQYMVAGHTDEPRIETDGAKITRIDLTTNFSVGQGNEVDYLRGLGQLPYKYSIPNLYANGKTVDWLSKAGKGSQLIYACVYNKVHDLQEKTLPKVKRAFGAESPEYKYLLDLIEYCRKHGVVRWEQKFKSKFLRDNALNHYGHINWEIFRAEHEAFLNIQNLLKVEAMTLEHVAEKLISEGVVDNTKAANTTAFYAFQWMHGRTFDCKKSQEQTHRARLRKIGIDIAHPCDLTKFSPVFIKEIRQVNVCPLQVPSWYQRPERQALRAVA